MTEHYEDWTSCEWYGHSFDENGHCTDCGEQRQ
jgi:hypothetical protein